MPTQRHYLVPAGIAELTLRNRSFREFQVYMSLKHLCRGQIRINREVIAQVSNTLLVSSRTVKRCIASLRAKNWIGYNPVSGISFIRGFDQIRIIERIKDRTAFWFDIQKIRQIKGFVVAVGYGQIAREMKRRGVVEGQKKERAKQKTTPPFYPIALSYFAKVYNCCPSTSANYRRTAEKAGFIDVKQNLKPFLLHGDRVKADQLSNVKAYTDGAKSLIVRKGMIYQQLPDRIKPVLNRKKRPVVMKQKKAK